MRRWDTIGDLRWWKKQSKILFLLSKMTAICKDLSKIQKQTADKANVLQTVARKYGLMVVPFETLRTKERQAELYSIGRTIQKNKKPVTWTMHSLHLSGKAVDRVFEKTWRQWDRDSFWHIAKLCWFEKVSNESCHTQDNEFTIGMQMKSNSSKRQQATPSERTLLKTINDTFRSLWYK